MQLQPVIPRILKRSAHAQLNSTPFLVFLSMAEAMEVKSRAFAEREKAIVDESLYGPPACKLFLPCVRYERGVPDKLPLTIPLTTSLLLFARRW